MVVTSDTATTGQKEIRTEYPLEEGLILGTTKLHDRTVNLVPEVSIVSERERAGL